jgi:hypothetical protein
MPSRKIFSAAPARQGSRKSSAPKRGLLGRKRYSPEYQRLLTEGLEALRIWIGRGGGGGTLRFEDLKKTSTADRTLERFVDYAYTEKLGYSFALHAILGVQWRWRRHRGGLSRAWDSMVSWRMELPIQNRVPIPLLLLRSFAAAALTLGFYLDPERASTWIPLGVALRLGYKGLLRPGEIGSLMFKDVRLPGTPLGLRHSAVLLLRRPKTRRVLGRHQIVHITDKWCVRWLRWLSKGSPCCWSPEVSRRFGGISRSWDRCWEYHI